MLHCNVVLLSTLTFKMQQLFTKVVETYSAAETRQLQIVFKGKQHRTYYFCLMLIWDENTCHCHD